MTSRSNAVMLTIAQYAAHRAALGLSGATRQAIEKAIRTGRISARDGRINPDVADVEWEASTRKRADLHVDGSALEASVDGGAMSYAAAKARSEAAVAEKRELELAKMKGELIDRAGAERAVAQMARMLRDSLVDILPAALAPELAPITDPWELECALRNSIREVLHAACAESGV